MYLTYNKKNQINGPADGKGLIQLEQRFVPNFGPRHVNNNRKKKEKKLRP